MKKLLAMLLALLLLAGCAPAVKEEDVVVPQPNRGYDQTGETGETEKAGDKAASTPTPGDTYMTLTEYPVVDGSTANLPLMAKVLSAVTGISDDKAEAFVSCAKTPGAYANLIDGKSDILLVYEPAEETKELIKQSGVELEFHPIGRDALVFIVNDINPVKGLTTKQLTDIYTGEITNWKKVGGEDKKIVPFQRASASGSQALFIKLLMQDTQPMEAKKELYPSEMGELIERLAEFNDDGGALGFSVFYYASYMYSKPGLRFLEVDGIMPSDESIADSTYPFLNEFYAVVRKDAPEDCSARKLLKWLLSDEGTQCIKNAGYIPVN